MKVIALEIDGKHYDVLVADVFSTNNELKVNLVADFSPYMEDSTLDELLEKLRKNKSTLHGVYLGHHIIVDDCYNEWDVAYDDGILKMYLYTNEMSKWDNSINDICKSVRELQ